MNKEEEKEKKKKERERERERERGVYVHQVSVQHPVGMQIVDSIQYLVHETLHHTLGNHNLTLLACLNCSVIFDDVLNVKTREGGGGGGGGITCKHGINMDRSRAVMKKLKLRGSVDATLKC